MTDSALPKDIITEPLVQLEADLDDESPEILARACERALAAGALDATLAPVTMKKGRLGTRIAILCRPEQRDSLAALLLRVTSTLGVRSRMVERLSLPREERIVEVHGQPVRLKLALWNGEPLRAKPEYEDCRAAAEATGLPLRQIMEEARAAGAAIEPPRPFRTPDA